MTKVWDAIVVGGGISGLVSALELGKSGNSTLLLEGSSQCGGSVASIELAGHLVDSGAESFAISTSSTLDLLSELGLEANIVEPARSDARILNNGILFAIPHGVMGIPSRLDDLEVKALLTADELMEAKRLDALEWNVTDESSIGEVVEKRMGRAVVEKIVNPIVAGVHASNSYRLEMNSVLPGMLSLAQSLGTLEAAARAMRGKSGKPGSAIRGMSGGVHTMLSVLLERLQKLGVQIKLESEVISIGFEEVEGIWTVKTKSGDFASRKLIIAVPARVAGNLLQDNKEMANLLNEIKTVDVAVVIMAVKAQGLKREPLGSGVLVAGEVEVIQAKASTHATAKWSWLRDLYGADTEIIRFSYGRDGVLPENLSVLQDYARFDLAKLYDLSDFEIIDSVVVGWKGSLVQSSIGHQQIVKEILALSRSHKGLAIVGSAVSSNGLTGVIRKAKENIALLEKEYIA